MCRRRWLRNANLYRMQARKALAEELPLIRWCSITNGRVVVSMLLTWLLSAGIVVVILMTEPICKKRFAVRRRFDAAGQQYRHHHADRRLHCRRFVNDRFGASKRRWSAVCC